MQFDSPLFLLLFLPLTVVLYYALPQKYKNMFLLAASLIFFAWGEPIFCFMLIISIIVNHILGKHIAESEGGNKKLFLVIAIVFNLLVAAVFRYSEFLCISLREFISLFWMGLGSFIPVVEFGLPFGVAFYTIQSISYNIDIYRGIPRRESLVDTGLYLTFFPNLIVGPAIKYKNIISQIDNRESTVKNLSEGLFRFAIGLMKIVLVSSNLKIVVDGIFSLAATSLSIVISWTGVICLALQVYYAFTGYVDMALGLARMFGFVLPEEFNNPYGAHSITDFWKNRWRISISSWFKDYIYIPLGGNRKVGGNEHSRKWMYINMGITIFLCALWHKASWLVILVGAYFGFFLMIEKTKRVTKLKSLIPLKARRILGNIYSVLVVMLGWTMLRANSPAHLWSIIRALAGFGYINTRMGIREFFDNESFIIAIIALIFALPFTKPLLIKLYNKLSSKYSWFEKVYKPVCTIVMMLILAFTVLTLSSGENGVFEYFRY
jgi:alginate O-acetyltransferase complex protein AlgI